MYLKLQPYVQTFVAQRACHKLAFRYYGPFQVMSRVGTVAYHIQLPATSSIHPVFHVSQLKAAVGFSKKVQDELPTSLGALQVPFQFLDKRLVKKGNRSVLQLLTHWYHSSPSESTWEDMEDLSRFRHACGTSRFKIGIVDHPNQGITTSEGRQVCSLPELTKKMTSSQR